MVYYHRDICIDARRRLVWLNLTLSLYIYGEFSFNLTLFLELSTYNHFRYQNNDNRHIIKMVTKITKTITNIMKRITRFHVEVHRAVSSSPTEKAIDLDLEPHKMFAAAKTEVFLFIYTV